MTDLTTFIRESNRIEGIEREPYQKEVAALERFLRLETIEVWDLELLVETFQPGARLRDKPEMNVQVGNHIAPQGGSEIRSALEAILQTTQNGASPYQAHRDYEAVHPFTDGNGRSGRALWLWMMHRNHGGAPLGFLHTFYYQALAENNG